MATARVLRRRFSAAALLCAVVAAGLAVHALLPDTAATDIAGDALYAAAVYLGVVVVVPGVRPLMVAAIVTAWCVAVELFQLTGIPLALGAEFAPAMLLLGTVFDARDLLVYVIGVSVMCGADVAQRAVLGRRSEGRGE
ncbi:ribosomal maturation YjgA family protein [Agromyces bauzanensis]